MEMNSKNIKTIYCDFDGTITKQDSVNTFFEKCAADEWQNYENLWIDGKITSQENAIKQVALLRAVSKKELNDYINSIEITDGFIEFIEYLQTKNIDFVILSDGFDLFIQKTLERFNIKHVKFFANHLIHKDNDKFEIEFPYHNVSCDIGAGMCKCKKIKESEFCYIGDGTSDLCVARKANILFATKNLEKYCNKNLIKYYHFNSFYNIIDTLKELL